MTPEISKELQKTLLNHPEHKNVFFDEKGRHYFNVFMDVDSILTSYDGSVGKKLFGTGEFSHRRVIDSVYNVEKRTETLAKGDVDTLIVEQMSRKEVLDYKIKVEETDLLSLFANATPAQIAAIQEMLGGKQASSPETKPSSEKKIKGLE